MNGFVMNLRTIPVIHPNNTNQISYQYLKFHKLEHKVIYLLGIAFN